jgi:hypothetical protein
MKRTLAWMRTCLYLLMIPFSLGLCTESGPERVNDGRNAKLLEMPCMITCTWRTRHFSRRSHTHTAPRCVWLQIGR